LLNASVLRNLKRVEVMGHSRLSFLMRLQITVEDGIDDRRAVGFERTGSLLDYPVSAAYPPYPPHAELFVVLREVPALHPWKV